MHGRASSPSVAAPPIPSRTTNVITRIRHGHGGRTGRVAALDAPEDVDGRDLGLERQVPRDQHDRAELADRPREGERDPREDRREQVRKDDVAERPERPGPERGGGLLHLAVELEQHGLHRPDHERQRHEQQREQDGRRARTRCSCRPARSARTGRAASGRRRSSGSANGRSMIAFTSPCPRKRSRIRIHATTVPITALIRHTPTETASVSFSAAIACGSVTASQKLAPPGLARLPDEGCEREDDDQAQVRGREPDGEPGSGAPEPRTAVGRERASARAATSAPVALLDLGHDSRARVEELLVDLRPAAEPLDREHARRVREAEPLRRAADNGSVAVLRRRSPGQASCAGSSRTRGPRSCWGCS